MPRLSVILPHISTESALEQTLLSLLEHRDRQCEIIVVHAGNYSDPYHLANDEIVLVESDQQQSTSMLNEGIFAATGQVIQILFPGTEVDGIWYRDVIEAFEDYQVAAVSSGIHCTSLRSNITGIRASQLPRHQLSSDRDVGETVYPILNGGYFRRKLMTCLNGLIEEDNLVAAETELAAAIQSLGVCVQRYEETRLRTDQLIPGHSENGYAEGQHLGRIARAYSALPESLIAIDSLPVRMGKLAASLLNPASISHRLGWTLGLQDSSLAKQIRDRFHAASQSWNTYIEQVEKQHQAYRRAA